MTKVLIVLTGAKEWSLKDGSKHFGGVWSPEFVYPHDRFTKAGYEVVVATLGGVPAPVDPASLSLGVSRRRLRRSVILSRICVDRELSALGWRLGMSDLTATKFNDCTKPMIIRCESPNDRRHAARATGAPRASLSKLANCFAPVCGWFTEGFNTRDLKRLRRC